MGPIPGDERGAEGGVHVHVERLRGEGRMCEVLRGSSGVGVGGGDLGITRREICGCASRVWVCVFTIRNK